MGRSFRGGRDENGIKRTVQVKVDGNLIERGFRNKGEAIDYLRREEGLEKHEIKRRVRFIFN